MSGVKKEASTSSFSIRPSRDISISSRTRRKNEFYLQQKNAGGWLWIDGRRICKTKKGQWYGFHKLDGVVDHFFKIPAFDVGEWKDAIDPPEDWCEVCCDYDHREEAI